MDDFEVIAAIVLGILAIAAAIALWPITVSAIGAYIWYRVHKKNELNALDDNLRGKESQLTSTKEELESVENQKKELGAKMQSAGEEAQRLNSDYIAVSRFSAFFSQFSGTTVSPRVGIAALEDQMEKQARLCSDLEGQDKRLTVRASQLERQGQSLTEEISILENEIKSRRK